MESQTREIILKQIEDNQPEDARKAFEVLIREYYSYEEALEIIGHLYEISGKKRYSRELQDLEYGFQSGLYTMYAWIKDEESEYDENIRRKILRIYKEVKENFWEELDDCAPYESVEEDVFDDLLITHVLFRLSEIMQEYDEDELLLELYQNTLSIIDFDENSEEERLRYDALRALQYVVMGMDEKAKYEKNKLARDKRKDETNAWPWIKQLYMLSAESDDFDKVRKFIDKVYPLLIKDQFVSGNLTLAKHIMGFLEEWDDDRLENVTAYYNSVLKEKKAEIAEMMDEDFDYDEDEDYDEDDDEDFDSLPMLDVNATAKACRELDFSSLDSSSLFHLIHIYELSQPVTEEMIRKEPLFKPAVQALKKLGYEQRQIEKIINTAIVLEAGEHFGETEHLDINEVLSKCVQQDKKYFDKLLDLSEYLELPF